MKRSLLLIASVALAATTVVAASDPQNPSAKKAQNPCNPCAKKKAQNPCTAKFNTSGQETTVVGFIGDSQCGLQHPMNMGDAKECTLKCIKMGSHFVLADRDKKVVYLLDKEAQMKVREFAGQKVKLTGHVNEKEKTIHMTKIEPAS